MADDGHPRNRAADEANEEPPRDHYEEVGRQAREQRERAHERAKSGHRSDWFQDFWKVFGDRDPFEPPRPRSSTSEPDWRALLGHPTTLAEAKLAFKKLTLERHPDRGGTNEQMIELNAAMVAAERNLR